MTIFLSILCWLCLAWALLKVIDVLLEAFPPLGDGISPDDISWWICRPFSFRNHSLPQNGFHMLVGAVIWIVMIVLTVLSVIYLF